MKAKTGCTRAPRFFKPPDSATAITPKIGKPTAVMRKPMKAESDSVPACTPSQGGKIRLPAPKNIAKSVRPTKLRCLSVNACISEIPPPQEKALRLAHAIPRNALVSRDSPFDIPLITALCIMEISLFFRFSSLSGRFAAPRIHHDFSRPDLCRRPCPRKAG